MFRNPAYRAAKVIELEYTQEKGSLAEIETLKPDFSQVKRYANLLANHSRKYVSEVESEVIKALNFGAAPYSSIRKIESVDIDSGEIEGASPIGRLDPGLIVDFPKFDLSIYDAYNVSIRNCVTVCLHDTRSKIWTRVASSLGHVDRKSISEFVKVCAVIGETSYNKISIEYKRDLESTMPVEFNYSDMKINVFGRINSLGLDFESRDMGLAFSRAIDRSILAKESPIVYSAEKESLLFNDFEVPLGDYFRAFYGEEFRQFGIERRSASIRNIKNIIPFVSEKGVRALLFVVRSPMQLSLLVICYNEVETSFHGAKQYVDSSQNGVYDNKRIYSMSLSPMTEVMTRFAKAY